MKELVSTTRMTDQKWLNRLNMKTLDPSNMNMKASRLARQIWIWKVIPKTNIYNMKYEKTVIPPISDGMKHERKKASCDFLNMKYENCFILAWSTGINITQELKGVTERLSLDSCASNYSYQYQISVWEYEYEFELMNVSFNGCRSHRLRLTAKRLRQEANSSLLN